MTPPTRPWRRRAALLGLAVLGLALLLPGSPAYLPGWLVPRASHEGRSVRQWMARLGGSERMEALAALGSIGPDAAEAVPAVAAILREGDESERVAATLALMKIGKAAGGSVEALAEALADPEPKVRMNAALALSRLSEESRAAIPALARALRDEANATNLGVFHHTIQEAAAVALGRASAGREDGVAPLAALLRQDAGEDLLAAAARGLGEIGEPARSAVPLLAKAWPSAGESLKESIAEALEKLGEDPAKLAALPRPDELPEAERAYLWRIENRGNELMKHGFGALGKALQAGDRKALGALLHERFEFRAAVGVEELDRGFATRRGIHAAGAASWGFVSDLLQLRRGFIGTPEIQFGLKALRPSLRGKLDGEWQGVAQMRLAGEHAPGAPAEAVVVFDFRLPKLTREALGRPRWLGRVEVQQSSLAKAPRRLFDEAAAKRGLRPERLHDNWKAAKFAPVTGGVYVADFDRDGVLDVLVTDLDGCWLHKGKPGGGFDDVTAAVGLPSSGSLVACWIDIDGDGWEDLILGDRIFRNVAGKRFADHTRHCNLRIPPDASGLVVADYDRDGKLDVYATRPGKPAGKSWLDRHTADALGNRLYRNKGGWKFEDVTRAAGADGGRRSCFTAAWLDADGDGWPDLHVINEFGDGVLLVNKRDGTFRQVPLADKMADFGSMGLAVGDVDNDGNMDVYCANMFSKAGTRVMANLRPDAWPADTMAKMRRFVAGSQLHLNRGGLKFDQVAEKEGIAAVGWAYGAALADLDNDGWLDIYATAGYISRDRDKPDG
ncbi:MAG: FG-GAP-like repeat-containing protein [Gemmataceae bacterium]|nr:FG-GAP-like repeat-containing protein [Gemmataceae bacterium]